ncbi:MAG: F0F1 ATP synthase subunit delta [Actinobacteria bacterium]|nr:F0F1 ATP synthase subunit delta [Actinomycetota bacterium]
MKTSEIAHAFAFALFQIAKTENKLDLVEDELNEIRDVISSNLELKKVISGPTISKEKKKAVCGEILKDFSPITINWLYILIDLEKENMLSSIIDDYSKLAYSVRKRAIAKVITAIPLSEEQSKKIAERLSSVSKKNITLREIVDPSIIGGIVVYMDGRVIDGSIRHQLDALHQKLVI